MQKSLQKHKLNFFRSALFCIKVRVILKYFLNDWSSRSNKNRNTKTKKVNHSFIVFKNIAVIQTTFQKHLGVIIDSRLTFVDHLDSVQSKLNKAIGLLRKLQVAKHFTKTGIDEYIQNLYKATPRLWWHSLSTSIQHIILLSNKGNSWQFTKETLPN